MKKRTKLSPKGLAAFEAIVKLLDPLPAEARERVLAAAYILAVGDPMTVRFARLRAQKGAA